MWWQMKDVIERKEALLLLWVQKAEAAFGNINYSSQHPWQIKQLSENTSSIQNIPSQIVYKTEIIYYLFISPRFSQMS